MTDRTEEFHHYCSQFPPSSSSSRRPVNEVAQFSAAAAEVSTQVVQVADRLAQLTQLVRENSMFEESARSINLLTGSLTGDLQAINQQVDNLQMYVNSQTPSQGTQHAGRVVQSMQTQIYDTTEGLKSILQIRQENVNVHAARRARYQHEGPSHVQRPRRRKPAAFTNLPRPGGVEGEGGGSEHMPLIAAPLQMTPTSDTSYVSSRADAVSQIESSLVQLGTIFGRLAGILSSQGEMVARIDDNIEEAMENVEGGQGELERHFRHLSDNRILALKLGGMLLSFLIFFLFFMA